MSDEPEQIPDAVAHWFYANTGESVGPFSSEHLQALLLAGVIQTNTLIAQAGWEEWREYNRVFGCIQEHELSQTHAEVANSQTETGSASPTDAVGSSFSETMPQLTVSRATSKGPRTLLPLLICVLGFGWLTAYSISNRVLASNALVPVALLAFPSVFLIFCSGYSFLRPRNISLKNLKALFFTMFAGLAFLLIFQAAAQWSLNSRLRPIGPAKLIVIVLDVMAWAYRASDSPAFWSRLGGCIFGVGICEEFTKLLPLFFIIVKAKEVPLDQRISYREFLFTGFLSGMGFGIGEALCQYSPWSGNVDLASNVLRWFALVPSHAIWTVTSAACLWALASRIQRESSAKKILGWCALSTGVVAVAHGILSGRPDL